MAGIVVLGADYLPALNRARSALLQAGFRVLTTTHVPAAFPLARLYLPDAVVLLQRRGAAAAVQQCLDDLAATDVTRSIPVVLMGMSPVTQRNGSFRPVTVVEAFDTVALLQALQDAARRRGSLAFTRFDPEGGDGAAEETRWAGAGPAFPVELVAKRTALEQP